eukprot:scaffold24_cov341-Pavlova_lutheri.AAC.52
MLEQVKQSLAALKSQEGKEAGPGEEEAHVTTSESLVDGDSGPWDPLLDQALKQTFVEMDDRIKSRVSDGTTATLVLLKMDEEEGVHIKCAWAGDSRSLLLREGKKVDPLSIDHNPTNENEANRMRAFKREELLQMQGLANGDGSPKKDPAKQKSVNQHTFRIVPDQLDRGAFRISPDVTPETSTHGEDQYTIFDIAQIAQRSFIGKFVDPTTGMSGCKRIFSTSMASSLAVSRTIGDKGAARCVTAEPEIIDQKLAPGEKGRIMIASDGIWDVMSNRKASDCWYPRDPLVACRSITDEAHQARRYMGYHPDDITLLLVDIHRSDKTRKKRYSVGGSGGSNNNSDTSGPGAGGSVYNGMSTESSEKSKSAPPMQPQACCSIHSGTRDSSPALLLECLFPFLVCQPVFARMVCFLTKNRALHEKSHSPTIPFVADPSYLASSDAFCWPWMVVVDPA